jgi:hypothetical protein
MARAPVDDVRRWSGWPRAAEHAAGRGRGRVGTEHLLLALVHGPPGPARAALTSVGVVTSVVHRALEAIAGPNGARLVLVDPTSVEPGDRTLAVLVRAGTLAEGSGAECDAANVADGPRRPEDIHVLASLVTGAEPGVALLVLQQLDVVQVLRDDVVPLLDRHARPGIPGGRHGVT